MSINMSINMSIIDMSINESTSLTVFLTFSDLKLLVLPGGSASAPGAPTSSSRPVGRSGHLEGAQAVAVVSLGPKMSQGRRGRSMA